MRKGEQVVNYQAPTVVLVQGSRWGIGLGERGKLTGEYERKNIRGTWKKMRGESKETIDTKSFQKFFDGIPDSP